MSCDYVKCSHLGLIELLRFELREFNISVLWLRGVDDLPYLIPWNRENDRTSIFYHSWFVPPTTEASGMHLTNFLLGQVNEVNQPIPIYKSG